MAYIAGSVVGTVFISSITEEILKIDKKSIGDCYKLFPLLWRSKKAV
jgi:hypothetical protein